VLRKMAAAQVQGVRVCLVNGRRCGEGWDHAGDVGEVGWRSKGETEESERFARRIRRAAEGRDVLGQADGICRI